MNKPYDPCCKTCQKYKEIYDRIDQTVYVPPLTEEDYLCIDLYNVVHPLGNYDDTQLGYNLACKWRHMTPKMSWINFIHQRFFKHKHKYTLLHSIKLWFKN